MNDRAVHIKVALMNSDGEEIKSEILDENYVIVDGQDMDDILTMFKDIKETLEEMRDDPHTWSEVRLKGNIEIYEDELALTTRIIERYGS